MLYIINSTYIMRIVFEKSRGVTGAAGLTTVSRNLPMYHRRAAGRPAPPESSRIPFTHSHASHKATPT